MNRTSFRWADRHDRRRKGIDDPGVTVWLWAGFALFVTLVLALDLWVFHRKAHVVGMREAAVWYSVWVGMALLFSLGVFVWMGQDKGLEFLAGYIIELSLSVDNLFVFMVIFASFAVPIQYQHRVLFYGILGALLMRGAFIATGVTMLHLFHWTTYLFGAFLVVTAFRLALGSNKEIRPEHNPVIRIARRFLPISQEYHGQQFFLKRHGKWLATPLLLVLLIVETTDLVFALDSVPAVLAISRDPFIVYTSNIFGILGLRALFFVMSGFLRQFRYLNVGLALVLGFVGVKMLLSSFYAVPTAASLMVIVGTLAGTMLASHLKNRYEAVASVAQ